RPPRPTLFPYTALFRSRPITDLASSLEYDDLATDAARVLDTLAIKEVRITAQNNRRLILRILPYVTTDKVVDGVVVTVNDFVSRDRKSTRLNSSHVKIS